MCVCVYETHEYGTKSPDWLITSLVWFDNGVQKIQLEEGKVL